MTRQTRANALFGDDAFESVDMEPASKTDVLQVVFWSCLLIAVAAASVALAWPQAVGGTGPVLLISMAAGGMVFLLWVVRGAGRKLGMFPERGAAAEAIRSITPRFSWIEALDEAVLICDRGGAPLAANEAYLDLTRRALAGQSEATKAVSVDRIFSASPGLAAPIFRLSKAAGAGETRREALPATTLGVEALPAQYEISVAPLNGERAIWRLRSIAGASNPAALCRGCPDGLFRSPPGWVDFIRQRLAA